MSWRREKLQIRRYLRDPDAKIWSDEFLIETYNSVQQDYQHRTKILQDVRALRVPGVYHFAYMHDWEYQYLPSQYTVFYQCLSQHDDLVFTHRWETQERTGLAANISDYGVHWTQPWESFMGQTPGEVVQLAFPQNMGSLQFMAYDEEVLVATNRKAVQSTDPSWVTHEGEPVAYYVYDEIDQTFVLYPRPATSFSDALDGNEDGIVFYEEGDTEDVTTGNIATRDDTSFSELTGGAFDMVDVEDNVFLVYEVRPVDMVTDSDESDFPEHLLKYVRYGTIARAYGANTDGRIRSLAEFWLARYELGVQFMDRYRMNRRVDRNYRLSTRTHKPSRRRRLPRLPDTYPAI